MLEPTILRDPNFYVYTHHVPALGKERDSVAMTI